MTGRASTQRVARSIAAPRADRGTGPAEPRAAASRTAARASAVQAAQALAAEVGRAEPDLATVRAALDALATWCRRESRARRGSEATPAHGTRGAAEGPRWRGPAPVPTTAEVRAWARRRGLRVAATGRLPAAVVSLYLTERGRWPSRWDLPLDWWVWNDNRPG